MDQATLESIAVKVMAGRVAARMTPYLLGLLADGLLQGILLCQSVTWLTKSYRTESAAIRILAFWLMLVGLSFTVVQTARVLEIFACGFGRFLPVFEMGIAKWLVFLLYVTHVPAEMFYVARVYVLSGRNKVLLAFFTILLLAVLSLAMTSMAGFPETSMQWSDTQLRLFSASASLIAAVDICLTGSIVFFLWRRRTGISQGDRLIKRLVLLSAETQLPTSIFALLMCVLDSTGQIWVTPVIVTVMCKSSSVAVFTVLNSRRSIREDFVPRTVDMPPSMKSAFASHPGATEGLQTFPSRIAVLDYSLGTNPDVVEEGDESLSSQQHLYSLHEILTDSGHSPSASSLANSKPEEV
ncbi:hypothetical protein EHS25_001128 [Saitozyma podzolica]|uniref:DUF6534 domain-containing protein n=1 Tax=Saitozyma podzolica TaxID=1890683 RepID=A0A427YHL9_9TREE|nr:hypothetical protein EHS25_001128 [Saitozyma podzolica]